MSYVCHCRMKSSSDKFSYRRKGAPSEDSIFQCIGMLAQSVGPALTKHMHELLDLMFAYGLSPSLHAALQQLGRDIPPLLPDIQGELAKKIDTEFLS